MPVTQLNCHPFTHGRLSFMHNGVLGGYRLLRRQLLDSLSAASFETVFGSTDSEHVFALFLDEYASSAESNPLERLATGLESTIRRSEKMRRSVAIDEPSLLNVCVSDGHRAVASRFVSDASGTSCSLYLHQGKRFVCSNGICRMTNDGNAGGAVIISSEPLTENPGWERVPENHLVMLAADRSVTIRPLNLQ
jgi:predicted glutamine amidotransferase